MTGFDGFFKALEDIFEASSSKIDRWIDAHMDLNIDDCEAQLGREMEDFDREYCQEMPQESLGGQTVAQYVDGLSDEDICRMAGLHELYVADYFPVCLKDRIKGLAGTEAGEALSAAIREKCAITDDVTASEVNSALELYSCIPDGCLLDVLFRTLENVGRRVEQGEAEWEIAEDGVYSALSVIRSDETDDAVIAYLDEAETLSARHTLLLRYIAGSRGRADDAYRLLKKAVQESADRAYLIELFATVGNSRGIAFLRGFVRKNPALADRLVLSEIIRTVSMMDGDPSDLLEMYESKYGGEEH